MRKSSQQPPSHWRSVDALIALTAISIAVAVFALFVEPGFVGLAILPALPLIIGVLQLLAFGRGRVVITDRRVMLAKRLIPRFVCLDEIRAIDLRQGALGRRLGYGTITLRGELDPSDPNEARYVARLAMRYVRDPEETAAAAVAAADRLGIGIVGLGKLAKKRV